MALLEYKCPNCDGAVNFDSSLQQMKCPYCDSTFDVESLQDYNNTLKEEANETKIEWQNHDDLTWSDGEEEGMAVYSCNSCAGEIVVDASTSATSCPFCGSPVVMTGNLSGCVKPDYIIPFQLDKKAAKDSLLNHLSGKFLLPKCFKDTKRLEEVKGVYVPFWLFDAEIGASMRYRATKVRMWSDTRFNYTETRYFNVMRQGNMAFDSVPVDASAKMPADLMEAIEPFDIKSAVEFQTAYLAGYMADKFEFSSEHCVERANERIKESAKDAFARTVTGYNSVMPEHCSVSMKKSTVKYALLPVWVMNATWRDKSYLFAMNGQTGKFVGDLPTDWGIFWRWFVMLAVAIIAVLNLIVWVVA